MMSFRLRQIFCPLLIGTILFGSFQPALAGLPFFGKRKPKPPRSAVELLADFLDELSEDIEEQGSIVPKQPDVWGEARLTKYRRQYEEILECQLPKFQETIGARVSRSDQAYLATALVLSQMAVEGGQPAVSVQSSTIGLVSEPDEVIRRRDDGSIIAPSVDTRRSLGKDKIEGVALEPTIALDQLSRYLNHLNTLRRISDGDDTSDYPGYALHMMRIPVSTFTGEDTRSGYGAEVTFTIEPYMSDDLLPQTFRSMVVNDLVDQIAFPLAAFLDRDRCYGLLDIYFKIQEDKKKIFDQKKYLTGRRGLRDEKLRELKDYARMVIENDDKVKDYIESVRNNYVKPFDEEALRILVAIVGPYLDLQSTLSRRLARDILDDNKRTKLFDEIRKDEEYLSKQYGDFGSLGFVTSALDPQLRSGTLEIIKLIDGVAKSEQVASSLEQTIQSAERTLDEQLATFSNFSLSLSPSRQSRMPFPPSMLLDVYGTLESACVAKKALAILDEPASKNAALVLDVQRFLTEEIQAAYRLLTTDQGMSLWYHCTPNLVDAIHRKDRREIQRLRDDFFRAIYPMTTQFEDDWENGCRPIEHVLAWAIIVESALLNDRMVKSIHSTGQAKGCEECLCSGWLPFFLPRAVTPTHEFGQPGMGLIQHGMGDYAQAQAVFKSYVKCKWPVHVFALDPVTQDQNVADSFALRREMQLALAVGLSSGQIGVEQFTQYARRIEIDVETIGLNRTSVGFSHGRDTFGWRFYPRVQTPRIRGNLHVAFNDLLVGGPTDAQLLREHQLEPGTRECVALVLMPSFVPYARLDSRAHWFELTDPSDRKLDFKESVELSRKVQALRYLSTQCTQDAHLYRNGEVRRLLLAVEQLDRKLPLQTSMIELPYQTVLGGFELLTTGAATLAPEVYGFYGEPGILVSDPTENVETPESNDPDCENCESRVLKSPTAADGTTVFVVGRNFSLHETKVIAGNRPVQKTLISREVMQVTIPKNVLTVERECGKDANGKTKINEFVDLHIATPYGVSNHLLIPAEEAGSKTELQEKVETVEKAVSTLQKSLEPIAQFGWKFDGKSEEATACAEYEPDGTFKAFTYHEPSLGPKLTFTYSDAGTPVKSPFRTASVRSSNQPTQLAFWLVAKNEQGETKTSKSPIGIFDVTFDAMGRASLDMSKIGLGVNQDSLEKQIDEQLKLILSSTFDAKTIELHGYLRFVEMHPDGTKDSNGNTIYVDERHADAQPVRKIGNLLTIKLNSSCRAAGRTDGSAASTGNATSKANPTSMRSGTNCPGCRAATRQPNLLQPSTKIEFSGPELPAPLSGPSL